MAAIQFLELQIRILAGKIDGRLTFTRAERREMRKYGKALGERVDDFLKVVTPATWHRWGRKGKPKAKNEDAGGRPKTDQEIQGLVVKMANENAWGLTRIYGELRKLGLCHRISRTTVRNILIEHGFDPKPKRGPGTWAEFIEIHRKSLWCCDFLTKPVETPIGTVDYHILFFKQIDAKEVFIAGALGQQLEQLHRLVEFHRLGPMPLQQSKLLEDPIDTPVGRLRQAQDTAQLRPDALLVTEPPQATRTSLPAARSAATTLGGAAASVITV